MKEYLKKCLKLANEKYKASQPCDKDYCLGYAGAIDDILKEYNKSHIKKLMLKINRARQAINKDINELHNLKRG